MDVFLDDEEGDPDYTFDQFEMDVFGLGPIDDPTIAPVFAEYVPDASIPIPDAVLSHAFDAAVSAEDEDLETAKTADAAADKEAEEILNAANILMSLRQEGGEGSDDEDNMPSNAAAASPAGIRPLRLAASPEARAAALASPRAAGPEMTPAEEQAALLRKQRRQAALNDAIRARAAAQKRALELPAIPRISDDISIGSRGTIARKFILSDIRLETLSPDEQASIIHGTPNFRSATSSESCCALCGFAFKDRGSIRKGVSKELAISYDHFLPVNFAAVIFRVVSREGKYTEDEFKILSLIGDMVCWHCNYSKGQAMFVTCPVKAYNKSFDNLQVNAPAIEKFYKGLVASRTKWAYNSAEDVGSDRTSLMKCLKDTDANEWVRSRVEITLNRSRRVIDTIKRQVDFDKARQRILYARATIRRVSDTLHTKDQWIALGTKMTNAATDISKEMAGKPQGQIADAIKKRISGCLKSRIRIKTSVLADAFAKDEVRYPRPWKDGVLKGEEKDNSEQPFPTVECFESARPPEPSSKKTRRGGKRNKTFRARRRCLPKLV